MLRYPTVEEVVMVEIDERVFRLCQEFLPVTANGVEEDSRMKLLFDDGLAYVKNAPDQSFDLILVDSTDPISVGEGLFTTEFYKECYRVLNEDGILINQHESPYFAEYAANMKKHIERLKIFSQLLMFINIICQHILQAIGYLVLHLKPLIH